MEVPPAASILQQPRRIPRTATQYILCGSHRPSRSVRRRPLLPVPDAAAGYEPAREVLQRDGDEANVSLVLDGLMGGSPFLPETAFSLPLLEFYHQLRRRHQVGIQGFMKVICSTLSISYYPALQEKFSQAFDAYFDVLERLQKLSDQALGRDAEGWRLRNACPCCSFQQAGEPVLVPARLHAMDGCSSHKRLNGVGYTDERVFESSYFQTPQQVDVFKDEVKPRKRRAREEDVQDVEEDEQLNTNPTEGLPTDVGGPTKCTDRWVTENASSTGKTAVVFEQTGIFIGACRHGMVELVQEMVRSGELAKYPLAMLDTYMREFGEGQCIGYDIGCSMDKTVQATSLKDRANDLKLILIVNAFHGYAHNRLCQLCHHPLFRTGLGLEDFETCKRIFSSLGTVARLIRHASHFHWKMFIHLHIQQWDEDRYAELSNFLLKNYKQALEVLREYEPEVRMFKAATGYTDEDFDSWTVAERRYLQDAKKKPEADAQEQAYVQALVDLENATYAGKAAKEAERRAAVAKLSLAQNVVADLERRLGLPEPWTAETPEYQRNLGILQRTQFDKAVDHLEGLVVQRLFELAKANISGTGYKMRKHISAAITRRSAAVRSALNTYNRLAPKQDPPRQKLEYSEVANYGWLGEFDLLKESRHEVLEKPWSQPANREAVTKYLKVHRAREEIQRLNVEIPRLRAWVDAEDETFTRAAASARVDDGRLADHLRHLHGRRRALNDQHLRRLHQIYRLAGYTGPVDFGMRVGFNNSEHDTGDVEPELEIEEHDELNDEMVRLGEALEQATL
ncbi:hypothetical protein FA95DRAFT_1502613 [Auriscalpium vulgare]|uniref:Uncharacterized protein n=1 Tax=Auriscalpium vulgare TaxID=40419 RepID=A0ACB8R9X9_9AGAM|nr:hypothetical protein FA95DRAFT_1502613 [Auriscalpium vulgare]